jgi:hypothetical protein
MAAAQLASFERVAACFDGAIVAARDAIIAADYDFENDPNGVIRQIDGMIRLLKGEARMAICLLAASDLVEHHGKAEACRVRMADAINLQRAVCRCIRQGIVPLLPASYAEVAAKVDPEWTRIWMRNQFWLIDWAVAWNTAWISAGRATRL